MNFSLAFRVTRARPSNMGFQPCGASDMSALRGAVSGRGAQICGAQVHALSCVRWPSSSRYQCSNCYLVRRPRSWCACPRPPLLLPPFRTCSCSSPPFPSAHTIRTWRRSVPRLCSHEVPSAVTWWDPCWTPRLHAPLVGDLLLAGEVEPFRRGPPRPHLAIRLDCRSTCRRSLQTPSTTPRPEVSISMAAPHDGCMRSHLFVLSRPAVNRSKLGGNGLKRRSMFEQLGLG